MNKLKSCVLLVISYELYYVFVFVQIMSRFFSLFIKFGAVQNKRYGTVKKVLFFVYYYFVWGVHCTINCSEKLDNFRFMFHVTCSYIEVICTKIKFAQNLVQLTLNMKSCLIPSLIHSLRLLTRSLTRLVSKTANQSISVTLVNRSKICEPLCNRKFTL